MSHNNNNNNMRHLTRIVSHEEMNCMHRRLIAGAGWSQTSPTLPYLVTMQIM